jgi:hypothetical protein
MFDPAACLRGCFGGRHEGCDRCPVHSFGPAHRDVHNVTAAEGPMGLRSTECVPLRRGVSERSPPWPCSWRRPLRRRPAGSRQHGTRGAHVIHVQRVFGASERLQPATEAPSPVTMSPRARLPVTDTGRWQIFCARFTGSRFSIGSRSSAGRRLPPTARARSSTRTLARTNTCPTRFPQTGADGAGWSPLGHNGSAEMSPFIMTPA